MNLDKFSKTIEKIRQLDVDKAVEKQFNALVEKGDSFSKGAEELLESNDKLRIGVVGQVKAGKSSFLNSLLFDGVDVLPRASTPMTAGLTIIQYSKTPSFEIEFYSSKDWDIIKAQANEYTERKESIKECFPEMDDQDIVKDLEDQLSSEVCSSYELFSCCSSIAQAKVGAEKEFVTFDSIYDLQKLLVDYVGADGNYTSVTKSLTLNYNNEKIKDLFIVDTPGVNDPIVSRENRTKEFLRSCHGVFLLSYSGRFCDDVDMNFLKYRIGDEGIGSVVVLASKFDSILQEVAVKYNNDLGQSVVNLKEMLNGSLKTACVNKKYDKRLDFDIVSGISYSIAQKEFSQLDEMEEHVLKRMCTLYPDYLEYDDHKEMFMDLSNIEEIANVYLKDKFKDNKDKIIEEKIRDYFPSKIDSILNEISAFEKKVKTIKRRLQSTDLDTLTKMEESLNELVSKSEKNLKRIFQKNSNDVSAKIKEVLGRINNPRFNVVLYNEKQKGTIYKGTIIENEHTIEYYKVDSRTTIDNISDDFVRFKQEMLSKWNNNVSADSLIKMIRDDISTLIKKNQQKGRDLNASALFDIDELYYIIDGVLSKIKGDVIPEFTDIDGTDLEKFEEFECDVESKTFCNDKFKEGEKALLKGAENLIKNARNYANGLSQKITQKFKGKMSSCNDSVVATFKSLDKELVATITEEVHKYIEQLKEKKKEQEAFIAKYDQYLDHALEVRNVLKELQNEI